MDLSLSDSKSEELSKASSYAMNLKYLDLSFNNITNNDLKIISRFNYRLIELKLIKCNLSSEDVKVLSEIIQNNKSLQLLQLEENDFGDNDKESLRHKIDKNLNAQIIFSDKCKPIVYPTAENSYCCNEANVAGIDIGSYFIKLYKKHSNGNPIDLDLGNGKTPILTTLTNTEIPYVYNVVGLDSIIDKYSEEYECHSPIRIRNNNGKTEFSYDEQDDKYISLDDVMTKILISINHAIKSRSGNNDNEVSVVFTIPIDFDDEKKENLKKWSKEADIKVVYFLYQPVAAAISYCHDNNIRHPFDLFVCDFGATHYSFTLLRLDPVKKLYKIINHRKNDKIGGNLFTERIADYFLTKWENIPDENNNRKNLSKNRYKKVIHSAENVKLQLTNSFSINCDCSLFESDDYDISNITEAAMNEKLRPEYDYFENDLKRFIDENKQIFDSLKDAIGIGGSIKMIYLQKVIQKRLGAKCKIKADNVNASGCGSCLFATNVEYQVAEVVDYERSVNIKLNGKLLHQIVHRFHTNGYSVNKNIKYKYNANDILSVELVLNNCEVLNTINVNQYVRSISSHEMDITFGIKVDDNGNIKVRINNSYITSF